MDDPKHARKLILVLAPALVLLIACVILFLRNYSVSRICSWRIKVSAWQDTNGDGWRQQGEPPLENVRLVHKEFRDSGDGNGRVFGTSSDGTASLMDGRGPCPTQVNVSALAPEGYSLTTPGHASLLYQEDTHVELEFGFQYRAGAVPTPRPTAVVQRCPDCVRPQEKNEDDPDTASTGTTGLHGEPAESILWQGQWWPTEPGIGRVADEFGLPWQKVTHWATDGSLWIAGWTADGPRLLWYHKPSEQWTAYDYDSTAGAMPLMRAYGITELGDGSLFMVEGWLDDGGYRVIPGQPGSPRDATWIIVPSLSECASEHPPVKLLSSDPQFQELVWLPGSEADGPYLIVR